MSTQAQIPQKPFFRVKGMTKRYPGVLALDNVDGALAAGLVVGLVGKNGAGKSSLIKVFAGAVQPDEGEMRLDGEPVHFSTPVDATKAGFAFVHQELALVPGLSVAENIELGLGYPRHLGLLVDRRKLRQKANEVLDRLGASIDPDMPVGSLSVARQRLVMIARGLATNARMLVLDEPTASLTEDEISQLHKVVRSLRDSGVSVLYVSHRLDEIFGLTDFVTVMRDGRVVSAQPTASIDRLQLIQQITGGRDPQTEDPNHHKRAARVKARDEEVLRVEGLSRGVVRDVSFTLRRGELLGIAGLVGAGRTELARMIFGADKPDSGQVFIQGKPVTIDSPREALGAGIVLLPEDRRSQGNISDFSIRANVTLPVLSRYRRTKAVPIPDRGRERRRTDELIDQIGIKTDSCERPVRWLSGGNQQKVVLAKWLERGADVLIFDEPTHGIDVEGKEEVYRLMEQLAASGKGVIFISSEFNELERLCERVLIMRDGRIVGELDEEEITVATLVERCYEDATAA